MIVNAAKHEIALNHIKDTYKYIRIGNGGDDTAASQTALDAEIPQDYNIVMNAVNKTGWDGAKILIVGSPGSGKTLSLRTLTKGENK